MSKHKILPLHGGDSVQVCNLLMFISFQGVVKIGAVDMDDQQNQPLGGQYGIRGFPTIKVGSLCTAIN